MKKKFLSAVILILAIVLASCGTKSTDTLYVQKGIEVIDLMNEIAANTAYIQMMSGAAEITAYAEQLGNEDRKVPKAVYSLEFSSEAIMGQANALLPEVSEKLREFILARVNTTLATQVNAAQGSTALAASSMLTAGNLFVGPADCKSAIYLFVYENAHPVMVNYTVGEGGAVSATGTFVLSDKFLSINSEADIMSAFDLPAEATGYLTVKRVR